ncbi:hypothetical protein BDD12DRAFT_842817 [Trichophaea hybrida]|nr:hypothetical protein BDD12DRAFT_842817 [Trichophaea hybrida]
MLRKGGVEVVDLACETGPLDELTKLRYLHEKNSSGKRVTTLQKKVPKYSYSGNSTSGTRPYLSFTPINGYSSEEQNTDLPSPRQLLKIRHGTIRPKILEEWEQKSTTKRASEPPLHTDKPKKRAWFESDSSPLRDELRAITKRDEDPVLNTDEPKKMVWFESDSPPRDEPRAATKGSKDPASDTDKSKKWAWFESDNSPSREESKITTKRVKDSASVTDRPKKRVWFESDSSPLKDEPSNMAGMNEKMMPENEETPKGMRAESPIFLETPSKKARLSPGMRKNVTIQSSLFPGGSSDFPSSPPYYKQSDSPYKSSLPGEQFDTVFETSSINNVDIDVTTVATLNSPAIEMKKPLESVDQQDIANILDFLGDCVEFVDDGSI